MSDQEPAHQALAVYIADKASPLERIALMDWARQLLAIRAGQLSKTGKARAAIAATLAAKVIWPTVRMAALKIKEMGWDKRSRSARFGMAGAAVGLALFGGHGAGIAALGTAIGVPLWVVLGAGSAFASGLVEELKRKAKETAPR